jgi:hypothetical protein
MPRSAFSSGMSRPAAEEQFREQNPWANPQHPLHQQQHIGRLSHQVSDKTPIADATITPVTQKSMIDLSNPAGSTSTIPEQMSAQASSALATPYTTNEGMRHEAAHVTVPESDLQLPAGSQKPSERNERLQSLSPTETRKHNFFGQDTVLRKANSTSATASGIDEISAHSYKPSRIALFNSPARPESLPRHGSSNDQIGARHATSSPITLHQHARESNLTSAPGLSRIGAR